MLWNKSTRARKLSQSAASSKPYHLNIDPEMVRRYGLSRSVVKELYRCDGGLRVILFFSLVNFFKHFSLHSKAYYRGYLSSVATYVPNSALWWMFYPVYSEKLVNNLPSNTSHMLIHCSAGSLSGMTVASKK